ERLVEREDRHNLVDVPARDRVLQLLEGDRSPSYLRRFEEGSLDAPLHLRGDRQDRIIVLLPNVVDGHQFSAGPPILLAPVTGIISSVSSFGRHPGERLSWSAMIAGMQTESIQVFTSSNVLAVTETSARRIPQRAHEYLHVISGNFKVLTFLPKWIAT